ncbi:hypothetical protein HGP28_18540 [Vibrio sp. SM6]|uniref:Dynamin N-terminal domain-containing protein n=1 Tax=Vibrio agarilyticus TaxID=2726741 RepID=A0A7X8YIR4_9VIBR|nr:dynamin family protein [Vibrio agarilyticus]NLS14861.1 hypothetical protein [Vibrio agarilyticus]
MVKLSNEELQSRYELLCKAGQPNSSLNIELQRELAKLEKLITHDLVELTRKGCPDNIIDILQAFEHELTRFSQFCEFPDLATKSIVGVGGGFSAGKSTFINELIGKKCLAVEIDPTTSMPTFVLKGQQESIKALNMHDCAIELTADELASLTHEEKDLYGSQVSLLLKSSFVSLPEFAWDNLAILDTPGYSKAEEGSKYKISDESLAFSQLSSSNFIIWFVPSKAGTMPESDIAFLSKIDKKTPILIILSRADEHSEDKIHNICKLILKTSKNRGLNVVDVLPYTRKKKSPYSIDKIIDKLNEWNKNKPRIEFAQKFKKLFINFDNFIEEEKRSIQLHIDKLNKLLVILDDKKAIGFANELLAKVTIEYKTLLTQSEQLIELNHDFFSKIKEIGDYAGVSLPEPNAVELMELKPFDLVGLFNSFMKKEKIDIKLDRYLLMTELHSVNSDSIFEEFNCFSIMDIDGINNKKILLRGDANKWSENVSLDQVSLNQALLRVDPLDLDIKEYEDLAMRTKLLRTDKCNNHAIKLKI